MIQRMREQAAAIGCDAIVLGWVTDHEGAQPGSGWDLVDPGATHREATCIVYDDSPRVRPFKTAQPTGDATPPREGIVPQRADGEKPSGR
jgi:hypothetical protein